MRLGGRKLHVSRFLAWYLMGIACIVLTIAVGIGVSKLVRPMFYDRYLFPIAVIFWLLIAVAIAKVGGLKARVVKAAIAITLSLIILVNGVPRLASAMSGERERWHSEEQTMAVLQEIDAGDVLFSDNRFLAFSILECYFPGSQAMTCLDPGDLPSLPLDANECYLFLSNEIDESYRAWIIEQEWSYDEICQGGMLGTEKVNVYRLQKHVDSNV